MKVTFLCKWPCGFLDPDYEGKGVGGSEATLILLSRELVQRGHQVEIYNRQNETINFNGVLYRPIDRLDASLRFDSLILLSGVFPEFAGLRANRKIFWCTHTVTTDWNETIVPHVSKVIAISEYHAAFLLATYPALKREQVEVMELGIRTEDYFNSRSEFKTRNQLIYCSVPERGVGHLARLFPRVRALVPGATLVITSDESLWGHDIDHRHRARFQGVAGVTFFGKVPRKKLVELQTASQVMAYPCAKSEAFCLSAMECIAAGCVPVTTRQYAFPTTVADSGILIDGGPGEPRYDEQFVQAVVGLLTSETRRNDFIERGRARAFQYYSIRSMTSRFEAIVQSVSNSAPAAQAASHASQADP